MAQALAQDGGVALPARPAVQPHTLNDWLVIYEGLLAQRGYDPQTIKNRRSNLVHVRRLWGNQPLREVVDRLL